MFNRKNCKKCNNKVSGKFDFCPHCGNPFNNQNRKNYGMLGKNDSLDDVNNMNNPFMGGINPGMLNKMLGGAMKMLEKELQKEMKNQGPRTNFELYINGKKVSPSNIKVTKKQVGNEKQKNVSNQFSEEYQKKFADLPQKDPETNIRRLSNKVVYEIDIPGVESLKDISIAKLENSIEIKAIAKDKAYKKLIQIDLPLTKFKLDNQKLILELDAKE